MQGHDRHTIGLIRHVIARCCFKTLLSYSQHVQLKRALPKLISHPNPQVRHCHLFDASLDAGRLLLRRSNALGEDGTTEDRGDRIRATTTPLLNLSIGRGKYWIDRQSWD